MGMNDFGWTAWGKDWVRLAETLRQIRPEPQLPRARRLVLCGRVRVTVSRLSILGSVGYGRGTAEVGIEVAPMSDSAKADIARLMAGHTVITEELYAAVAELGYSTSPKLTNVTCTCGTKDLRCVHILAVYYDISRQVDDDPSVSLIAQGCIGSDPISDQSRGHAHRQDVVPQRWIALARLDRKRYFSV